MYARNYKLLSSKFREFFFPTLFTSMTGNICMVVDSIIVSNLIGAMALSAIQPVIPVSTSVNLVYWMIGLGGSVLCSIAKAEFDSEWSNRIFSVSIISLLLFGILVAILGTVFAPQIVPILCSSPQVQPLVYQYYGVYVLGMPFLCYIMSLSYFIRTDRFVKLPFRALLLSNIINIIFDIIFIKVFNLGVSGAAWATIVGYIFGCTYMSTYFFNSKKNIGFCFS